jgi:hypothetical protein
VASWAAFEAAAPELAGVAHELWPAGAFHIAYLATIRPDGGPRLHPFCPILAGGRLLAAIPPRSPKGDDLRRDPRCVVHAMPGPDDAELCIRARAREVDDDAVRAETLAVVTASGVGGMIATTRDHPLFELDVCRVDVARWVCVGQEGTYAERRRWVAPSAGTSVHTGRSPAS